MGRPAFQAVKQPQRPMFQHDGKIVGNELLMPVGLLHPQCFGQPTGSWPTPTKAEVVIDTGAQLSVINPQVAASASLPQIGLQKVVSANGQEDTYPVVAGLVIFPARNGDVINVMRPLVVMPCKCEMLFGMDLLSVSILTVDGMAGTWRLRIRV